MLKILRATSISRKRTAVIINTAQILHMYMKSIIKLQKLQNNKLELNYEEAKKQIEVYINEVLDPFDNLILKKELIVKINNLIGNNNTIVILDWNIYQLIMFHLI